MCFPFNSDSPAFAIDAKLTTDIAVTSREGGGGKTNLRNIFSSLVQTLYMQRQCVLHLGTRIPL